MGTDKKKEVDKKYYLRILLILLADVLRQEREPQLGGKLQSERDPGSCLATIRPYNSLEKCLSPLAVCSQESRLGKCRGLGWED